MLAPTLLVGLGGTGSKVVCRVANMVTEEQRKKIGFAVFDTDINELREISEDNPFIKTIQTSTKLTVGEYLDIDTHARDSWFPVNAILNSKALTEGAGQVRAISRLALDTAIRAGKMEPLHTAIEDLYRLESEKSDQALRVIIVSSLAGGTGSGLILPIALYIKNYLATRFQQSANITRGFFILPEVFYEVIRGQSERNNLKCNAYATLREIDAFLMKGDATLPDKYADTVKIEFPRVGSEEFEQYNVRPYDFCFLFDAQNTEGNKLNSFNQYLDHAANCIYSQSIGPMNKRSNSSEDNTIRELCAEKGRNRYAGAGCAMLIYPVEDVKKYISLKWAQECVSEQWLVFDNMYREKLASNAEMRRQGYVVRDLDLATDYIASVDAQASQKNPFAMAIINSCSIFDESGLIKEGDKWTEYISKLKKHVEVNAVANQNDLDAQEQQTKLMISDIKGGTEVWELFQDAFREMEKYRALINKRSEDTARTIAYSIFKAKNDSATKERLPYQLETYLRDGEGKFIHPNAIRYFLYQALELFKTEKKMIDKKNRDTEKFFDDFKNIFDDPKTDEVETADQLSERRISIKNRLGKLSGDQEDMKGSFFNYMTKAAEYRNNAILAEVLEEGIDYIRNLCNSFHNFYDSFENKVAGISRQTLAIEKKYNNTKGMAARYVCASETCLKKLLKKMQYRGTSIEIDSDLAESIYSQVRAYAMLDDKPEGDGYSESYFGELFDKGILGYFKQALMDTYKDQVNMDIITALVKEDELENGECDIERQKIYVSNAIADARNLSHPFIERPLGEEREPISSCTYNIDLDPKDDSARSILVGKELKNYGGEPDEDIPLNMIMFFQAIYGLRANKLSKFSPEVLGGRTEGEYYKAYYELINQIKPKSDKTPVITPHIDKNWHIISSLPDLDDNNQIRQEKKIYKAFILGLLMDMIRFTKISEGKWEYKLYIKGCKPEDFVVSNGTRCDNFYEVLDALIINPVIVKSILDAVKQKFEKEIGGTGKVVFNDSLLKRQIDNLEIKEFNDMKATIFDLPTLLKVSTPASEFDKNIGTDIMQVALEIIYDYMKKIVPSNQVDDEYSKYILEQFVAYEASTDWYIQHGNDNFEEYIDEMMRIASEDLTDKESDEYSSEIDDRIKEFQRKRN